LLFELINLEVQVLILEYRLDWGLGDRGKIKDEILTASKSESSG